jgi:hypothetical protein
VTEPNLPQVLSAQAEAVVERAKSLGLTWTLRPGTVFSVAGNASSLMVTVDGDDVPIGVVSLIGRVYANDRVMTLLIPPGGNFIIGNLNDLIPLTTRVDSNSGTAAAGAEAVALTLPSMVFAPRSAYRVAWGTDQVSSVANVVAWRVRQGTTTAGTAVYLSQRSVPTGVGAQQRYESIFYVINSTTANITSQMVLTHQPSAGTTTAIGSATQVRYLEVSYAGFSTDYPSAFPLT